jgi:hypothetical protein
MLLIFGPLRSDTLCSFVHSFFRLIKNVTRKMSLSYAESLSYFPHKGKVGMPELSETSAALQGRPEGILAFLQLFVHLRS